VIARISKHEMPAYDGIIKAYIEDNPQGVADVINQYHDELNYDLNIGIAKQVHNSLLNRRFKKLSKVYISLSMDQIKDNVSIANETEVITHLLDLSYSNEVKIKIDDFTKNVRFIASDVSDNDNDDTNESSSNEVELSSTNLQQLQDGLHTTMLLSDKVRELRKNVLASSKYIMKMSSSKIVGTSSSSSVNKGEPSANISGGGQSSSSFH
jgi:hypothetical protein